MESLIFHSVTGIMKRRDKASDLPAAPNRNGSYEDHVMASKALPSPEVLRQLLRYDAETGDLFWMPREYSDQTSRRLTNSFNARFADRPAFTSKNSDGYLTGAVLGASVKAHRVAWAMHYGAWPEGMIDHINGDKTDNRIVNLRDVCGVVSARNNGARKDSIHPYPGVHRRKNKWIAIIGDGTRSKYLGSFAHLSDAVAAKKSAEQAMGYSPNHARTVTGELTEWRRN